MGSKTRTFDKSKFEKSEQQEREKLRIHELESLKEQVEELSKKYEKLYSTSLKQNDLIEVYRSRHGKMNEAIVELENESYKLQSFNKYGQFDINQLHNAMKNTISTGVENFKQF